MTQQTMQQSADNLVNGIDLDILMGTAQAISKDAGLGACRFRASNKWQGGTRNASTITGFYGAGEEMAHKQTMVLSADEPPILAGDDSAANPVEHLLNALAACVTTSMVAHAAVNGIHIEAMEAEVEGDLDLRGFLGLDTTVPKGFTDIRMRYRVKAAPEDMKRLRALAKFSPVYNTITRGANVEIDVMAFGLAENI